jgi:endonuclease YncB( thermonuclease family)
MKTSIAIFLSLIASLSQAETLSGRVVAIADGDTVTVLDDANVQHKIRLAGIDAPEKRQPYGQNSKEHLSSLCFGKSVTVEWDKKDRYQRIIGKVMVADPACQGSCPHTTDTSLSQIAYGLAWHYKKYQRDQSADDRESYAEAETQARSNHSGLWQDASPIPPWEWRHPR